MIRGNQRYFQSQFQTNTESANQVGRNLMFISEIPKNVLEFLAVIFICVLFTFLSYVKEGIIRVHGNIYAYDLNEPLIYTYKNIQSNHNELYREIQKLIDELNSCGTGEINRKPTTIEEAKIAKENYYYWIRTNYNKLTAEEKTTVLGSAMFIFLNKTCF